VVVNNSLWNRHLACSGEGCHMGVTTRKNTKNKVFYPIATAKTIKKFLISETLAIVTFSSFFFLPSAIALTESIQDTRHVIHPWRKKKPVSDETCRTYLSRASQSFNLKSKI